MKKIVILSAVFLFLSGCGAYNIGSPGNPKYVSLDEALAHGRYFSCTLYLQVLKRQAKSEKDRAIIERKMAECLEREAARKKRKEEAEEREKQERLERERIEAEREMPDCNDVTVFGIPLKKSLQEVVTSIENNGISITEGYLSRRDDWSQEVSMRIKEAYQKSHATTERMQVALQHIDQEKISAFSFQYKDVTHIARPYSLFRLLTITSKDKSCPVFDELPDIYNSQFYLACKGLPDYISYQSFQKITICFAAIDQKTPLSFLIELAGRDLDKDLAKRLVDKYGNPVLHWGANQRSKECLEHFKEINWGFSYSLAKPNTTARYIFTHTAHNSLIC